MMAQFDAFMDHLASVQASKLGSTEVILSHTLKWMSLTLLVNAAINVNPFKLAHGPLTRYVKLRITHAPETPGTFFPPQTSKEIDSWRPCHASWHVRDTRAVTLVGIGNPIF